ncbi:MAG: T9SS type A sorting domain-containing protein, partial [Bacteroidia bacterium]|nr:T9SS type A sorting domain-containing protein [Bacteroidia bacterium]
WDGTSWSTVGSGFPYANVYALAIYNNELYAGGYFLMADGNPANHIAKWNGTIWESVGTGISTGAQDYIATLTVFNGNLYAGGDFTTAGGVAVKNVAKWNGSAWSTVGAGLGDGPISFPPERVYSLFVHNNELYAGGDFIGAANNSYEQYRIAKFNGTDWENLGAKGISDADAKWAVRCMASYNNNLHVGGYFTAVDNGVSFNPGTVIGNNVSMWDGTVFSTLGTAGPNAGVIYASATSANPPVLAEIVYDNTLYVGGAFTSAGGIAANGIAGWNGTSWSAAGSGVSGQIAGSPGLGVSTMAIYNGSLIIGGDFTSAGGVTGNGIAKWTMSTTGVNEFHLASRIVVAPNPFTTTTTFTSTSEESLTEAVLTIYDLLGNEIKTIFPTSSRSILFDRKDLSSGIYFYSLRKKEIEIASGKLVVE